MNTMEFNATLLQDVTDGIGFDGGMTRSLDDGMLLMDAGILQWMMERGVVRWRKE